MTVNIFRDESFTFSPYNYEYLVYRVEVCLPVDSNIELKYKMNQILPLHTLTSFFLNCFFMLHSHMSASANTSSSSIIPTKFLYVFLFSPYPVHVAHNVL